MVIGLLRVENLRCHSALELTLSPGLNLFLGANGAGKTSLLEAVYLLSHARSFRSGPKESLVHLGANGLSVFAEVGEKGGEVRDRVGLARVGTRWQGRINGESPKTLEELLRKIAVICFEPGTHDLIAGGGEGRRSFLDWTLFHVEREFLAPWQRHQRALKQRNSLLRSGAAPTSLEPWNIELSRAGEELDEYRQRLVGKWRPLLADCLKRFLPELGDSALAYSRGWAEERSLLEALEQSEDRDLYRGFTTVGPHRADWSMGFELAPQREYLSRGQAKLCGLACVLAQGLVLADHFGQWPVVCLDDLASELDEAHQKVVLEFLAQADAQVLITGTVIPPGMLDLGFDARKFHVEQGRATPLL
jgi:DNA replication and repair protein RecF